MGMPVSGTRGGGFGKGFGAGTEAQSLKGQSQWVSLLTAQGPVHCVEASSAGSEWWGTSRGLQAQE